MIDNVDELTSKKTGRVGLLNYIENILNNKKNKVIITIRIPLIETKIK